MAVILVPGLRPPDSHRAGADRCSREQGRSSQGDEREETQPQPSDRAVADLRLPPRQRPARAQDTASGATGLHVGTGGAHAVAVTVQWRVTPLALLIQVRCWRQALISRCAAAWQPLLTEAPSIESGPLVEIGIFSTGMTNAQWGRMPGMRTTPHGPGHRISNAVVQAPTRRESLKPTGNNPWLGGSGP